MAAKSAFLVSAPASRKALYSRSHLCRKRPQTFALSKRHHKSPCMTLGSTPEERDFRDVNIAESVEMQDDMIVNIVDVDEDGPGVVDLSSGSGVKRKKVRHSLQSLIDEIDEETDSIYTSDADGQPPVQEDETARFVRTAVKAADERKGSDIQAMRVSKLTYITSFLIIITGKNTPQIRAIANLVEDDLVKVHDLRPKRIDGVANSGWMLMDCMY